VQDRRLHRRRRPTAACAAASNANVFKRALARDRADWQAEGADVEALSASAARRSDVLRRRASGVPDRHALSSATRRTLERR
jgi:hypothetical protein